jgi:ATP-dependent RNA helicase DeaD
MVDRLLEQGHASTDIIAALIHLTQPEAGPERPKATKPSAPAAPAARSAAPARDAADASEPRYSQSKPKFERERVPANEPRTGREPGMTPIFLNVGRKNLVTPADVVGKIAGVTRLPADIVGAIDILQRHTLVDVAEPAVDRVLEKLAGVRMKGQTLKPSRATGADYGEEH